MIASAVETVIGPQKYAILRAKKHKSYGAIAGVIAHAARTRQPANADPGKAGLNRIIRNIDLAAYEAATRPYQKRSDNVLGIELFMGMSPEWSRDGGNIQDWVAHNMAWADGIFGPQNVLLAALHMDETTPHLQLLIRPVIGGKLSAKHWLGGSKKMRKLQDDYAAAMAPLGLARGIKGSKAQHVDVAQYYAQINAAADIEPPRITTKRIGPLAIQRHESAEEFLDRNPGLIERAMAYDIARKNEHQLRATAKEEAMQKNRYKTAFEALNDKLREIDLRAVMAAWGYEPGAGSDRNRAVYRTPRGTVHVDLKTCAKFTDFACDIGGYGAISLVRHLEDCDYNTAVAYLRSKFTADQVLAAARSAAMRAAEARVAAIQPRPAPKIDVPDRTKTNIIRDYLVHDRGIPEPMVDSLIRSGDVYGNRYGACVFARRDDDGKVAGVAIRGTGDSIFKQTKGSLDAGYFVVGARLAEARNVVLTESAIDALSYAALYGDDPGTCILSLNGHNLPESLADRLLHERKKVVIAIDNYELERTEAARQAGGQAVIRMIDKIPNSIVQLPTKKDWNEMLIDQQCSRAYARTDQRPDITSEEEQDDGGDDDHGLGGVGLGL